MVARHCKNDVSPGRDFADAAGPDRSSFSSEDIRLDTSTGALHGTLVLPAGAPPFPVVLLIAGSGPTDRDGNSPLLTGNNDSLKMLAEGLAARGIASLRYDKRAVGASKPAGLNLDDLRFGTYFDDAVSWGALLQNDVRFSALTIAGHSEGSLIGMIAAERLSADGYVSIAGAGRPGGQIILEQLENRGVPPGPLKQAKDAVTALEEGRAAEIVPPGLEVLFHPRLQPYLMSWFSVDPAGEIARLKMPVLVLQGDTDIQVGVADAEILAKANPAAKHVVIGGMNHILKEVPPDMEKQVASYGDPSLPVAGRLLDEISAFIRDDTPAPKPPAPRHPGPEA